MGALGGGRFVGHVPNLVTSSANHQTIGGAKTSVVPRRSGVDIRVFCLLQLFDVFFHFR